MDERHEHDQYFFDAPTLAHLAGVVAAYPNPCWLCAPRLGQELERRGVAVRTLDIDTRFAGLAGFRRYDLFRPEWLGEPFGLIVCDPPFFRVSLAQLFTAIRLLSRYDYRRPLLSRYDYRRPLLSRYLSRRTANILGTFARFDLHPTGYYPGYLTVQNVERNGIEFFGNLAHPI